MKQLNHIEQQQKVQDAKQLELELQVSPIREPPYRQSIQLFPPPINLHHQSSSSSSSRVNSLDMVDIDIEESEDDRE